MFGTLYNQLLTQAWKLKRVIITAWLPPLLIIALVLTARLRWNIPVLDLTGDPIMLTDSPLYLGAVSYLGVLLWCATAVVSLFAAQLLPASPNAGARVYLRAAGSFSLLLCLDDLYLLHEEVFPKHMGVPQNTVLALYVCAAVTILWRHRQLLLSSEFVLLGLALGMFGLSVAVDVLVTGPRKFYLLEDGAKLLGVTMWLVFHTRMALHIVRRGMAINPTPDRLQTIV